LQCRHLDGNKSNNNLSNLKWGTRSENQMDRVACGNSNRGERSRMSKLKKEDVIIIRKLATKANKNVRKIDKGGNYKEIAKKFKVSTTAISAIVGRRTWGWLE